MNEYYSTIIKLQNLKASGEDITDEVRHILEYTVNTSDLYKWVAGDVMLLYLDDVEHGKKTQMKQWFAGNAGLSFDTLESYITTCSYWRPTTRFKLLARYPNISFSYLKESVSFAREYGAFSAVCAMREAESVADLRRLFSVKRLGYNDKPVKTLVLSTKLWLSGGILPQVNLLSIAGLEREKRYEVKIFEIKDS